LLKLRALLPILAIAVPIVLVALALANMQHLPFVQGIVAAMREAGREWWAIPLFLILYCVLALFLLPVGMLSAGAALVWGWEVGGLLDLVACTVAALPPFQLARRRLPRRVRAYLEKHGLTLDTTPDFFPLLLLRIVPVVPYSALNYIAGIAGFRLRDYVVATFAGSIPSVFLFAFFIDTLGDSAAGAATQLRILGACAAVGALAIIGRWGGRWGTRRLAGRTTRPPDGAGRRSASPEPPPERSSSPR